MRVLKTLLAVLVICNSNLIIGQNLSYVTADNGLTVRDQPSPDANRLGKLYYGEAIEIINKTNIDLVLVDSGRKIEGQWVQIQSPSIKGYVFNGYLSSKKIVRPIEFRYAGLSIRLKNLKTMDEFKLHTLHDKDTIKISVALGDTPEGKIISVHNTDYKHVSIFQRFQNSVTIMNEGPHCDLTEWKHYYSQWEPLAAVNKSKFKTLTYSDRDKEQFMDIDIDALKQQVALKCGQDWSNYIKDIKTVQDYPANVGMSRIFIKILITDKNNDIMEKVIEFELPMGC